MRDFYLFADPNGSGKSTIISPYLKDEKIIFLNADYCARADPGIMNISDGLEKSIRAQKETERQLHAMITDGLSFTWETVFSHERPPGNHEVCKNTRLPNSSVLYYHQES